MSGAILYRGPSELDGAPIVAIATMGSDNRKTGAMLQTWILREDLSPVDAYRAGADSSICGDCPQRWALGGACYVNIGQAPGSVWRAYRRGTYGAEALTRDAIRALGAGQRVRLGAYGDPAAVPVAVWLALTDRAAGWTGYTHQWRRAPHLSALCMASVDSREEWAQAIAADWRPFRVTGPAELLEPGEILCASEASGRTCAQCMACDGARPDRMAQASIAITVHGSRVSRRGA